MNKTIYRKLTDISLSDRRVAALFDLLDERADVMERREAQARETVAADALYNERYEKLVDIAAKTARRHVRLEGVYPDAQARLAWEAFCANEGYYSTFDVDDHFNPQQGGLEEAWILAYSAALPEGERRP